MRIPRDCPNSIYVREFILIVDFIQRLRRVIETYLKLRRISVPILLMDVDKKVSLPLVGIHGLPDVLGPVPALLRLTSAPGLLEYHAEGSDVGRHLSQVLHHLEDPNGILRHDVGHVS